MQYLKLNPLSYVHEGRLTFQHQRTLKCLTLTREIRTALAPFFSRFDSPVVRLGHRLPQDPEPLVNAGILVAADQVETLIRREERIAITGQEDGDLIYLLLAAERAGITWWIVHDGFAPVVLFSRRTRNAAIRPQAAYLHDHSFLGEATQIASITRVKAVANHLGRTWGWEVPRQVFLPASIAARAASPPGSTDVAYWVALQWQSKLGFPLIVKPAGQSVSRGVTLVRDEASLERAVARVFALFDKGVVVERRIRGPEWRVLMLASGRYAAYRRIHPSVLGNGRSTVRELIDERQRQREEFFASRRYLRHAHAPPLGGVVRRTLLEQRLRLDSVVARGRRVSLSLTQTHEIENTSEDATALLSRAKQRKLLQIVKRLGAARLGFDLIGAPISAGRFPAILEVNSRPFLVRHEEPDRGDPQPAARMLLDMFLSRGLSSEQLARLGQRVGRW